MTQITVIMPVFNGEQCVKSAIESIQAQTFQEWKLLILNDGSQDYSLAICRGMAAQDDRITIINQEINRGLGCAMNTLLHHASNEFIAVQEQDDISLPHRLEQEINLLQTRPEVGVVSGIAAWMDDQGNIRQHFPGLLVNGKQYPQDNKAMVRYL